MVSAKSNSQNLIKKLRGASSASQAYASALHVVGKHHWQYVTCQATYVLRAYTLVHLIYMQIYGVHGSNPAPTVVHTGIAGYNLKLIFCSNINKNNKYLFSSECNLEFFTHRKEFN